MSFSQEVKAELTRVEPGSRSAAVAECFGLLLYCNTFSPREIKLTTGVPELGQLLPRLFKRAFNIKFDSVTESGGKRSFTLRDEERLRRIFSAFGYEYGSFSAHHINFGLLEEPECREAFVRGAFLAGGSVVDPGKRYHLEFATGHYFVSRELMALFIDMGFESGSTVRRGNHLVYFKRSEVIADLLTTMGAPVAAMNLMAARIDKSMTNTVNRKVNCDTANVLKTVVASETHMEAIRRLRERGMLQSLPEGLYEAAILREENPELSLTELAAAADPPITKSGLNHRLRRLVEIANSLSQDK